MRARVRVCVCICVCARSLDKTIPYHTPGYERNENKHLLVTLLERIRDNSRSGVD